YKYKKILDFLMHNDRDEYFVKKKPFAKNIEFYIKYPNPLDLSLMNEKVDEGYYDNKESEFNKDLLSIFQNAIDFYPKDSTEHFEAIRAKKLCLEWIEKGDQVFEKGIPDLTFRISCKETRRYLASR